MVQTVSSLLFAAAALNVASTMAIPVGYIYQFYQFYVQQINIFSAVIFLELSSLVILERAELRTPSTNLAAPKPTNSVSR